MIEQVVVPVTGSRCSLARFSDVSEECWLSIFA